MSFIVMTVYISKEIVQQEGNYDALIVLKILSNFDALITILNEINTRDTY